MQKSIYICLITLFCSLSAFAGPYDEYGYNNSSFGSPMYNTGAMGGGTYWAQLATDFYTQSNAVNPYSYSQTIDTKVQTSDQGIRVVGDKPASTPTTVVKKDVEQSRATGWDVWWIYPATTVTSTREQTVNIAQANTTVLTGYGPNTYFNFNVYNPAQQNYAYNTYQATSTGPVLVASTTQSGPPPMSVQYTAIPRSVSTGPLDASPGSKFQIGVQLYNQKTLTLDEASKVITDFIDRVIPDAPNGRIQFIGNVISKVASGLPADQNGQASALVVSYVNGVKVLKDYLNEENSEKSPAEIEQFAKVIISADIVDPKTGMYPKNAIFSTIPNNSTNFLDSTGKEPVPSIYALNPWFTLKSWQWYSTANVYDSSTFNDAANYCTQHLKANAYQNIGQRNAYYEWVDSKVAINSRWFGAAEIVTKWNAVGAADNVNAWYLNDPADAFLKAGNKYLFPFNMANAKSIINTGGLTGTFIDANGATVNFNGLKNKALDYAMVKLEQSKVQDFIKIYKTSNPSADMNSVMSSINFSMTSKWAPSEIVKVISENFESTKLGQHSFDFTNYNDRVILGQKIVDQLYK